MNSTNKILILDLSKCKHCEACLELCPEVFKQNEAGYIEVATLPSYPEECIQDAINCCPTDCIAWRETEEDSGEKT